jgi:Glycosyltransferase family 87
MKERTAVAVTLLAVIGSCAGAALAGAIAHVVDADAFVPAAAGTIVGAIAACALTGRFARHLPDELDGWFARRPVLRWLWLVAAVFAVANTARISVFAVDPSQEWAQAFPPMHDLGKHQCLGAYVRAGELAATQANLWDPKDYDAKASTHVDGLQPWLSDTFEYPPTFAVIPRATLAVLDDYGAIRALWYGLSAVGFWLAYVAIARWVGGRPGASALLLAAPLAFSVPFVLGLQFGQAHLLVVAASIAAMLMFERGRTLTGGALLGFAIATKIFPGLLLVHLAMRRQWRALAATLGVVAGFVAVALAVLGPATFEAFITYHLPRMASGQAFAFAEYNPDNLSLYGITFKLSQLGFDTGFGLGSVLAWVWTAVAIALAALGARATGDRARDAITWLAIICLATLRSPFAPTYTAIGTLWLFALLGGVVRRRWIIAVSWILLQGFPPMFGQAGNAIASFPAQLISIGAAVIWAWPRRDH